MGQLGHPEGSLGGDIFASHPWVYLSSDSCIVQLGSDLEDLRSVLPDAGLWAGVTVLSLTLTSLLLLASGVVI